MTAGVLVLRVGAGALCQQTLDLRQLAEPCGGQEVIVPGQQYKDGLAIGVAIG